MCWTCFLTYADKPVINERVQRAFDHLYDRGHDAIDGFLHTIVADMNVDDWLFDFTDPDNSWRANAYKDAEPWERELFDELGDLTEEERATAVAMNWGYLDRNGTLRPDIAILDRSES